jgi:hypothetical protein
MLGLLVLLWAIASGAATLAQTTTGSVNPNPAAPPSAAKDDVPPGGCMPMGVTASGEIVFPLECKAFLEQHRGNDPRQEPAAAEAKPAIAPKPPAEVKPPVTDAPSAAQPPAATPQKSAAQDQPAVEKLPELPADKQPEAAAPSHADIPAAKEPETTTAAKEPEAPAAKEPETPAAKDPEAPALKQSNAAVMEDSRPADRPAKPVSGSRRAERAEDGPRPRSAQCMSYRTYDASSGTYRDYSGHIRPCR